MRKEEIIKKSIFLIERLMDNEALIRSCYDAFDQMVEAGVDADYIISRKKDFLNRDITSEEQEQLIKDLLAHVNDDAEEVKQNLVKMRRDRVYNETIQTEFDRLAYYFDEQKGLDSTYDVLLELAKQGVDGDFLLKHHNILLNIVAFPDDESVNDIINNILENINIDEEAIKNSVDKIKDEKKANPKEIERTIAIIFAKKRRKKLTLAQRIFSRNIKEDTPTDKINEMYKPRKK